ncbi:MAG: VCBS repeat-containing protein [Oscillospiraceae bacterium]|nr:VCBS repeat-containing protein [Oscillospiraceae bacterium]
MKRIGIFSILLTLLFAACAYGVSGDDLLALPRQPLELQALSVEIDRLIDERGGTLIAPISGANRQPIQKRDLTGDGIDNAIVFYQEPGGLYIAVFAQADGEFAPLLTIDLPGETMVSVAYADLTGEGTLDIIVGTQIGEERPLKTLSVFRLDDAVARNILHTDYDAVIVHDIDNSGRERLLTVHYDNDVQAGHVFLHEWIEHELVVSSLVELSNEISGLQHIRFSELIDGHPAMFVTSVAVATMPMDALTSTVAESEFGRRNAVETALPELVIIDVPMVVTDVLIYRDGVLENISIDTATARSDATRREAFLSIVDINGDGKLDIPMLLPLINNDDGDDDINMHILLWKNFNADGELIPVSQTFHNFAEGWYFILPELWQDNTVRVVRRDATVRERQVVLGILGSCIYLDNLYSGVLYEEHPYDEPLRDDEYSSDTVYDAIAISRLTGMANGVPADGRFEVLRRNDDVIVVKIFELCDNMVAYQLDEQQVREALHWIETDMLSDALHH